MELSRAELRKQYTQTNNKLNTKKPFAYKLDNFTKFKQFKNMRKVLTTTVAGTTILSAGTLANLVHAETNNHVDHKPLANKKSNQANVPMQVTEKYYFVDHSNNNYIVKTVEIQGTPGSNVYLPDYLPNGYVALDYLNTTLQLPSVSGDARINIAKIGSAEYNSAKDRQNVENTSYFKNNLPQTGTKAQPVLPIIGVSLIVLGGITYYGTRKRF